MKRLGITVTGIVQGVGFRPFVYNLAHRYNLSGWVLNNSNGVEMEVEGYQAGLDDFVLALRQEVPPLAVIGEISVTSHPVMKDTQFVIRYSVSGAAKAALVSPDVATCPDCRRELGNDADRRYQYPFINCTNCGPRYSIIQDVPYDRSNTTMAGFIMCEACQQEYDKPTDRRFHAQPNACPVCGPAYRLLDRQGNVLSGDVVSETRRLVSEGKIVAVKGIGGYHLACDACNERAVQALRQRKIRENKPFAVMAGSLETVRMLCELSLAEEQLLTGPARPIVLLNKKQTGQLASSVAPGNPQLGVMLPYAPVHWLLLTGQDIWVMTSGNTSDEPIAYDDADAFERLAAIADYFLVHNRPIANRTDDSVVRVFQNEPYMLRRSRGYVPSPLEMHWDLPPVLAMGGELKNTFCLTRGKQAFLGPHIGDLENMPTFAYYKQAINHFKQLFAVEPQLVAYDLHPEYLSTKYAQQLSLPTVGIQHHHAHIAAVMAEYGLHEPVIGVAFDGTGYGTDGNLWGGEFLVADLEGFSRPGHCRYMPLPGGTKAITEPWRMAAWVLQELYGEQTAELGIACTEQLPANWQLAMQAAAKGLNSPLTSSVGRLFDTAAALIGLRQTIHYEGQAAIELELAAAGISGELLPYHLSSGTPAILDFTPAFAAMVQSLRHGASTGYLAACFHLTLADATVSMVRYISQQTAIKKVVFSGGVFQNTTLLSQIFRMLEKDPFSLYIHRHVPANDGGLALGQAVIAGKKLGCY
jgi:hydrogenase maturation protein HypF